MLYTISFVFLFFFCDAGGYTCQAMFYCDYIHSPFLLNLLSHDLINLLALNLVMLLPQPPKYLGLQTCYQASILLCGGVEDYYFGFLRQGLMHPRMA